jgi:hypothetical protein
LPLDPGLEQLLRNLAAHLHRSAIVVLSHEGVTIRKVTGPVKVLPMLWLSLAGQKDAWAHASGSS